MKYLENFDHDALPKIGIFKDSKPGIDFSAPMATKSSLSQYYSCQDCNKMWQEINKEFSYECSACGSENITNLEEDVYIQEIEKRHGKERVKELEKEQEPDTVYHLANIQSRDQYFN